MGSPKQDAAASMAPPFQMYVLATVSSSQAIQLPSAFKNKYATFVAEGLDVFIRFGTATLTASSTAVSTVTSNVPAVATNGTYLIPAGTERHFDMRNVIGTDPISAGGSNSDIWFAHISSGTSGFLRFFPSEGDVAKQS